LVVIRRISGAVEVEEVGFRRLAEAAAAVLRGLTLGDFMGGAGGGERFLKASLRQSGDAFGVAFCWHA